MKEWHFVYNLFDGFPVEAIVKLKQLGSANSQHKFGLIGPHGFEDRVLRLDEEHVVALLGPAATTLDTQNMRMEEVSDLIKAVMVSVDAAIWTQVPSLSCPTASLRPTRSPDAGITC